MQQNLFNSSNVPLGIPLSQYTEAITSTVARAQHLAGVWVIAELSDVRVAGGHCYMELIEKNEAGQTVAKMRANIWRNNYGFLRQKFFSATQRDISNGIKALVRGSATHHSLYGLSFNITDIDPSYTMGDMERLRREIIQKLQAEGVAGFNRSLSFPAAPQKIAVISAEGAAGYGDFINQLLGNAEGFAFYPCLFPCIMQGDRVSESIRNALEKIEATIDVWDCVVIIRGGGATTDLNGFDEYRLARAVATFRLPIVVGIGHERDRNVLDDLANTSLKTPTAVAAFFIDRARGAYDRVLGIADRIRICANDLMIGEERRLSALQSLMPQLALHRLTSAKTSLQGILGKLPIMANGKVEREKMKLGSMSSILQNFATARLSRENLKIDSLINLVERASEIRIEKGKTKIENLASLIKVLDPLNTLQRGYSVTRKDGRAVKSIRDLHSGDIVVTAFCDGEIRSKVD